MTVRFHVHPVLWLLTLAVGWSYITNLEGRWFPAAKPMTLLNAVSTKASDPAEYLEAGFEGRGPYTAFWIESARLRPGCSFVAFDWHLGERAGQDVPVAIRPGPAKVRDNGTFTAGPWIARVEVDDFRRTYADVIHRCKIFGITLPWTVRSRFWN